jgi:hypothetical protein
VTDTNAGYQRPLQFPIQHLPQENRKISQKFFKIYLPENFLTRMTAAVYVTFVQIGDEDFLQQGKLAITTQLDTRFYYTNPGFECS